jgi:magnesium chelatase family protein
MQLRYGHFKSAALHGIDGIPIEIEVAILPGLPSFEIVGSGDSAIRESRNRIQAAIRTSGFQFPPSRVTASLAPAWLRKEGSAFDLPLALAILLASGQVCLHGSFGHSQPGAFGELGLDGQIRPVPGAFNRTAACRQAQVACLLVPSDSLNESLLAADASLCVNGADTLRECARILTCGFSERPPVSGSLMPATDSQPPVPDLAGIKGQAKAVRALTVAAAGWHHLLLLGSPGSGKTALAATIPGILPPLTVEESLLVTQIHSAASQRIGLSGRIEKRPFLAPHAGVTRQTLTGGGNPPVPGL